MLRMKGKKVLAFGAFDILHPGHVHYLKEAKKRGSTLTVIVARDSTVQKVKGRKPVNDERHRLELVQALRFVDKAVLGKEGNIYAIVKELKPDLIAMGYDQEPSNEVLEARLKKEGVQARIARMTAYFPENFKSSRIKRKVKEAEP